MRRNILVVASLSLFVAGWFLLPSPIVAQAPDPDQAKLDSIKKQIEELQKEIGSLQAQQKALQKALDKAEEKDYFSKIQVEVRGRLHGGPSGKKIGWTVVAKDMTWHLNFGDKKEWLELAKNLAGKTVVVTGSATLKPANNNLGLGGLGGGIGGYGGIMPGGQGGIGGAVPAPPPGFGGGLGGGLGGLGGGLGFMPAPSFTLTLLVETFKAP